jgi:hypothetical protein
MARAVGKPQTVQCEPVAEIGCSHMGQLDGTDRFQTNLETVSAGLKSIRITSTTSYTIGGRRGAAETDGSFGWRAFIPQRKLVRR